MVIILDDITLVPELHIILLARVGRKLYFVGFLAV